MRPSASAKLFVVFAIAFVRPSSPDASTSPAQAAAKLLVKCQAAFTSTAVDVVSMKLNKLDACAGGVFACIQKEGGSSACMSKAEGKCAKAVDEITRAGAKARDLIAAACSTVDVLALRNSGGLNFDSREQACAALSGSAPITLNAMTECVLRAYDQLADRLYGVELGRARELVGLTQEAETFSGLPSVVGCSDCATGETGLAKPILTCTKSVAKSSRSFALAALKHLFACSNRVFKCSQLSPGDGTCLAKTQVACDKEFAKIGASRGKFHAAISKACGPDKLQYASLRAREAANIEALGCECGDSYLDTLEEYADCIERQHECRVSLAVPNAIPRFDEMLASVDRDSSLVVCNPTNRSRGRSLFGVLKFLSRMVRPYGATAHPITFVRRPFPAAMPLFGSISKNPYFQGRGSTRFSFTGFRPRARVGAASDTIVAQVRRGDGSLTEDALELPLLDNADGDRVVIGYPDAQSCPFELEVSTRTSGELSAPDVQNQEPIPVPPVPPTGGLKFVEIQRDGIDGVQGLAGTRSIATSIDGKNVYVTSLTDNGIVAFTREPTEGKLQFLDDYIDNTAGIDGLAQPLEIAFNQTGSHLYVASGDDNGVALFSRNPATGRLTFVEFYGQGVGGLSGLQEAFSVTVSPDDQNVYVAGGDSAAIVAFARNAISGKLTFIDAYPNGSNGISGLKGARAVRVSPDKRHVYALGFLDNAVVTFARDLSTGALTFVEAVKDGDPGVTGMKKPFSVAISPDGKNVYVVGEDQDAAVVFSRDAFTGHLTEVQVVQDPAAGGPAGRPTFVIVSPDGKYLYAAGGVGTAIDAVVALARNQQDGTLTYVNGAGGVAMLEGTARSVSMTADEANVYATGDLEDALAVFKVVVPE